MRNDAENFSLIKARMRNDAHHFSEHFHVSMRMLIDTI